MEKSQGTATLHHFLREIARTEDYKNCGPVTRSAIRHDLLDAAHHSKSEELWREIAEALVRAYEIDDLTPQVSDHFVRDCPDEVFKQFATARPSKQFVRWAKRGKALLEGESALQ